jgi:hypothetical protein
MEGVQHILWRVLLEAEQGGRVAFLYCITSGQLSAGTIWRSHQANNALVIVTEQSNCQQRAKQVKQCCDACVAALLLLCLQVMFFA